MTIETILSPAELPALAQRDLRAAACVVFDILRATSTFVTALHHGAEGIIPVNGIPEALAVHQKFPGVMLAGEREGLRIRASQANGVDFDFGNSPREFRPEKIAGKTIVSTTTNGTRALRACAGAECVLAGSFLNLTATAEFLRRKKFAAVLLVCAGTGEGVALEDVLAAGALVELLVGINERSADFQIGVSGKAGAPGTVPARTQADNQRAEPVLGAPNSNAPNLSSALRLDDASQVAWQTFQRMKTDLAAAIGGSQNGRRLLANPELRDDVAFCAQRDVFNLVAALGAEGVLRRMEA